MKLTEFMGISNLYQKQVQIARLPTIRKVIRQGEVYICGICRSKYPKHSEAYSCLDECWHEVLQLDPVIKKHIYGAGTTFRCRFCCRDYENLEDATHCAGDCKEKQKKLDLREHMVRGIKKPVVFKSRAMASSPIMAPPVAPSRHPKPRQAPLPQHSAPVSEVKGSPTSAIKAPNKEDMAPKEPEAKVAPDPGKKLRKISDFNETFVRKDAKYCCRFCNSLFFTKVEVEKCFNDHFDENGVEIDNG